MQVGVSASAGKRSIEMQLVTSSRVKPNRCVIAVLAICLAGCGEQRRSPVTIVTGAKVARVAASAHTGHVDEGGTLEKGSRPYILVWDWSTSQPRLRRIDRRVLITNIALSPDGSSLAIAELKPPMLTIWATKTGEVTTSYPLAGTANSVTWAQDNRKLAVGMQSGDVLLASLQHEAPPCLVVRHPREVTVVRFLQSGSVLLSSSFDVRVLTWLDTGTTESIQAERMGDILAVSADERRVAIENDRSIVIDPIFSPPSGSAPEWNMHESIFGLAWRNSSELLIGLSSGSVYAWNVDRNEKRQLLPFSGLECLNAGANAPQPSPLAKSSTSFWGEFMRGRKYNGAVVDTFATGSMAIVGYRSGDVKFSCFE